MLRILRMSVGVLLVLGGAGLTSLADSEPSQNLSNPGPLTPKEELATFKTLPGFKVELVASEPVVVDPVAMAFDEQGRLFVAEMHGYPNGGRGTGDISSGKIKLLEDRDGDGIYEKATVFLDKLRLPTSVMPYKGGLLIANAPDLIYAEDTNHDGVADRTRVLYTGFHTANIQQMLNSLQWGIDNWIHACAGNDGGTITSPETKDFAALTLRNRGIRFHPDKPGSLEPTSGGGQYGLTPDDAGHWFTATNSQHLRHIVLPDDALRRNPALPVRAVTLDIPEHGAACKVFRVSPFEAWRVERTRRRKDGPDAQRFSSTELVPGGFVTSGCSPLVYSADLFPPEYRGSVYVCDPANNLILRDVLTEKGATFVARRGEADREFLASTDNWFRPVWLTLGPDGAIYVLDFYREVIETPLSLPDDIKKKLNLESRARGRIWRIVPEKAKLGTPPALHKATVDTLVQQLGNPNRWWRITAQRLLIERGDKTAIKPLEMQLKSEKSAAGRSHILWTLHGLDALRDDLLAVGLKDADAGVREHAVRMLEGRLGKEGVRSTALALADDPSPKVRFQLALSLGMTSGADSSAALAAIFRRDNSDPWTQTAVLSSCGKRPGDLLLALLREPKSLAPAALADIAHLVGSVNTNDEDLAALLQLVPTLKGSTEAPFAVLSGLFQGLRTRQRSFDSLSQSGSMELKTSLKAVTPLLETAGKTARSDKATPEQRVLAIRVVGEGPGSGAESVLPPLLDPREPPEVQLAAVRALAILESPKVAELLLAGWEGHSPGMRREVIEALFARPERLLVLLAQMEAKKVQPRQLEPIRIEQIRKHRDQRVRQQAEKVLVGTTAGDRVKIVESYKAALELKSDPDKGRQLFRKQCVVCHRLENTGHEVGADLLGVLRNKSSDQLLHDILDPSREVDPRYLNYVVTTKRGASLTGMIVAETSTSLTLRRGEKAEDVVLRSQIDSIQATTKSLMPEGFEMQFSKQELADLLGYLIQQGQPPKKP